MDLVVLDRWPLVGRHQELATVVGALDDPESWGVAITGEPGVGKSRLADEAVATLERAGRQARRVIASEGVGSIPLGAVAHLIPSDAWGDTDGAGIAPTHLMTRVRSHLADPSGSPMVIWIDDAQFLDTASATVLTQLASDGLAQLVVTAASAGELPDVIATLVRSGRMGRLELPRLTEASTDTLLHLVLGAPVEGRTAQILIEASGGNPLLLRELVRTGLDHESIEAIEGVWYLNAPLPHVETVSNLVTSRLDDLDDVQRSVLEVLALAGSSRLDLVLAMAELPVLERLEADDLVELHTSPVEGELLALSHPQVAAAVRARIEPLRRRRILLEHAERLDQLPDATDDDQLRVVAWRLAAGSHPDLPSLERACRTARARGDRHLTLDIAIAIDAAAPNSGTRELVADTCVHLGRWADAEEAYTACLELPMTPGQRARVVANRARNLHLGLGSPDSALALLREALDEIAADPSSSAEQDDASFELRCQLARSLVHGDEPQAALAALGDAPPDTAVQAGGRGDGDPDASRRRARWATAAVPALTVTGRTGHAIATATRLWDEQVRSGQPDATHDEEHLVALCHAMADHGHIAEAEHLAEMGYRDAAVNGALIGQVWCALHLGRCALLRGHPVTAQRWYLEARSLCTATGWHGVERMAAAGLTAANGLVGDLDDTMLDLDQLLSAAGPFSFLTAERALAPAWAALAADRRDDALRAIDTGVAHARDHGAVTSEAWLLHERVRLDPTREVVQRLGELATSSDSPLIAARAAHAAADAAADRVALVDTAERLSTHGCDLLAAEAFGSAAELAKRQGNQREATTLARRASEHFERCEGALTVRPLAPNSVVALSEREREIAMMAASGLTNRAIGERLVLSIRTVENHLQNAYTKLGISSRQELPSALGGLDVTG